MTSRVIGNPTLFGGVDVRVRVTGSQQYVLTYDLREHNSVGRVADF
jgi:hypothetical protein